MIEVEQLGVHFGMFKPDPSPEVRVMEQRLLGRFIGDPGRAIMEGIGSGRLRRYQIPEDLADRANTHFLNALAEQFGLPGGINLRRFWKQQEDDANAVHTEVIRNFPDVAKRLGMATEVGTTTGDITDTLEVLASGDEVGKRYKHEMRRRLLLGLVGTAVEADNMQNDLSRELKKIEGALNIHFFAGVDARTKPFHIYAYHDAITNTVDPHGDNVVLKRHEFPAREIQGGGKAFYDSRVKPKTSATSKAIDRAYNNGGFINPAADVQDRFGLILINLENPTGVADPRVLLLEKAKAVLSENYRPIIHSKPDDDVKTDRGQKPVRMKREKILFDGVDSRFEVMVFDANDFLDYQLEIGQKRPDGSYSGRAREFYETERQRGTLDTGYPQSEGYYRLDINRAIASKMDSIAPRLMQIGVMDEPLPVTSEDPRIVALMSAD